MTQDLAFYRSRSLPIEQLQIETIPIGSTSRLPIGLFYQDQRLTSFTVDNEALGIILFQKEQRLISDNPQDPVGTISELLGGDGVIPPVISKIGGLAIAEIARSLETTIPKVFEQMYVTDICKILFVLRYSNRMGGRSGEIPFSHLVLGESCPPLFEVKLPSPVLIEGARINFVYIEPISLQGGVALMNEAIQIGFAETPWDYQRMIVKRIVVAIPELTPGAIALTDSLIAQLNESTLNSILDAYQKIDTLGVGKEVEGQWLKYPRAFIF